MKQTEINRETMKQVKTPYVNKIAKRDSSKNAHISLAGIVGMANIYGVGVVVNVPKRSKGNLTELNIKILETTVTGNVDIYTIPGLPSMENPQDPKEKRRREISLQAYYTNSMIEYIGTREPGIQCQFRKRRPIGKSMEQIKLKNIDPFNEKGFTLFGERIIGILENMANGMIVGTILSKDGRGTKIYLECYQPKITELYYELLGEDELLSENGKIKKASLMTTEGSGNEPMVSNQMTSYGCQTNVVTISPEQEMIVNPTYSHSQQYGDGSQQQIQQYYQQNDQIGYIEPQQLQYYSQEQMIPTETVQRFYTNCLVFGMEFGVKMEVLHVIMEWMIMNMTQQQWLIASIM